MVGPFQQTWKRPTNAVGLFREPQGGFVDYESRADLKVFFVEYESRAGWRNKSKQHLLY